MDKKHTPGNQGAPPKAPKPTVPSQSRKFWTLPKFVLTFVVAIPVVFAIWVLFDYIPLSLRQEFWPITDATLWLSIATYSTSSFAVGAAILSGIAGLVGFKGPSIMAVLLKYKDSLGRSGIAALATAVAIATLVFVVHYCEVVDEVFIHPAKVDISWTPQQGYIPILNGPSSWTPEYWKTRKEYILEFSYKNQKIKLAPIDIRLQFPYVVEMGQITTPGPNPPDATLQPVGLPVSFPTDKYVTPANRGFHAWDLHIGDLQADTDVALVLIINSSDHIPREREGDAPLKPNEKESFFDDTHFGADVNFHPIVSPTTTFLFGTISSHIGNRDFGTKYYRQFTVSKDRIISLRERSGPIPDVQVILGEY